MLQSDRFRQAGVKAGPCRARGLGGETCPSSHLASPQAPMAAEHRISGHFRQLYAVQVPWQHTPVGRMADSLSRSASSSKRQPSARQTDERGRVAASHFASVLTQASLRIPSSARLLRRPSHRVRAGSRRGMYSTGEGAGLGATGLRAGDNKIVVCV